MTVDFTRKIGVSRAVNGGFSAVIGLAEGATVPGVATAVAPAPVARYKAKENVIYASGGRMRTTGGKLYTDSGAPAGGRLFSAGEDIYAYVSGGTYGGETVSVFEWFFNGISLVTQTAFRQRVYSGAGGPFGEPAKAPVGVRQGTPATAGQILTGTTDVSVEFPIVSGSDWTLEAWSRTVGPGGSPVDPWRHTAVCRANGSMAGWSNGSAASISGTDATLNGVQYRWADADRIRVLGYGVDWMGQIRYTERALYSGSSITVPTGPFYTP